MDRKYVKKAMTLLLILAPVLLLSGPAWAKAPEINPAAVQTLQKMTSYMAGLEKFSVHTENILEEELVSGQRIDLSVSASLLVRRPDKVLAERVGEETGQIFYYDGKTLTMLVETPAEEIFAQVPAPDSIEKMVDFAREDLGIVLPVSDLIYRNAQSILMAGVTSAMVIGDTVINDVVCTHLAFRRPDMDFQVWVAAGAIPLPCKYVVTDTSLEMPLSITSVMSEWNLAPVAADKLFNYTPDDDAQPTTFLPLESGSDR